MELCVECKNKKATAYFQGKPVCRECFEYLQRKINKNYRYGNKEIR